MSTESNTSGNAFDAMLAEMRAMRELLTRLVEKETPAPAPPAFQTVLKKYPQGLLGIKEVAEILGIAQKSLYHLKGRQDFPIQIKVCGKVKFDPRDIEDYIRARQAGKRYIPVKR